MGKVKDIRLAGKGRLNIDWSEDHMPVLMAIRKRFSMEKPLKGLRIAACLHVTKETAVLVETLEAGGAKVALCGSNPLSTQDDVAAALEKAGTDVYAWRGVSNEEYYWCLNKVLDTKPNITMDDGGDLVTAIIRKRQKLLENIVAGTEETTTGVIRFRAMEKEGILKYPIIAINDAYTKHLFDNRYGTGQSTIDGILRATSVLISGKTFVVGGYGWCSRGIAMRAKGMGANVIVTEVDPLRALEAAMDGFRVMPMGEAAKLGDILVSATGNKNIIGKQHLRVLKNGAVLANSGHFDNEIDVKALKSLSKSSRTIRENVEEFTMDDGRKLYLLAEGRLVNLSAAEGHPSEVMDMSFANQALVVEFIKGSGKSLDKKVHKVPENIDRKVAELKLRTMGINIDSLTGEQEKYLQSWEEGT